MKIELSENRVLFKNGSYSQEIHPFWLRERVTNEEYFDNNTQQRKFDPTFLKTDVEIKSACLLYTSPSPRDATLSRMPSSA